MLTISAETKAQLEKLHAQGLGYQAIAKLIPVSPNTLWKALAMEPVSRAIVMVLEFRLRELTAKEATQAAPKEKGTMPKKHYT